MPLWIKNPLAVLAASNLDASGGVVVDGGCIREIIGRGRQPQTPSSSMQIFDASRYVLLPGLINTHHHYYQTLTRAYPAALNKELFAWLKSLYPVWARLTERMIHLSTQLATAELLLSGCTTSSDHHYLFTDTTAHALDVQADALAGLGVRVTLTRGAMSLGRAEGGLPPQSTVQDEDTILADCARVIDRYHDPSPDSRLQIALAPCSPFSVTRNLMRGCAELAREKNVRLHTHLAEAEDETKFCETKFGMRPLDYLAETGWLADDVWLAHGIHFTADEIARLGATGVGIAHCPSSNMMLGSGKCKAVELEEAGCSVGLGVDGSASNDCNNLMAEVRQAFLLQRIHYGAARVSHLDALRWATAGSARCLGRDDIGEIAPGKQADLALFELDELRFSGAHDPLAALVLCGAHTATRVMIGGEWWVVDGKVVDMDLPRLRALHNEAAQALVSEHR